MNSAEKNIHEQVQELLPWFVNQTLPGDQLTMVSDHLRGCADCRQDVQWQRSLLAAAPAVPQGLDMESALARMMPRLEPRTAAQAAPASALQRLRERWLGPGWMPWALAGQGVLIAVLAMRSLAPEPGPGGPEYRVLGAEAAPATGKMVVAFKPEATLADLQRLMQANGVRMFDGPTVTGAYVVEVDGARQAQVAAAFKADPAVLLAEPLAGGGAR